MAFESSLQAGNVTYISGSLNLNPDLLAMGIPEIYVGGDTGTDGMVPRPEAVVHRCTVPSAEVKT